MTLFRPYFVIGSCCRPTLRKSQGLTAKCCDLLYRRLATSSITHRRYRTLPHRVFSASTRVPPDFSNRTASAPRCHGPPTARPCVLMILRPVCWAILKSTCPCSTGKGSRHFAVFRNGLSAALTTNLFLPGVVNLSGRNRRHYWAQNRCLLPTPLSFDLVNCLTQYECRCPSTQSPPPKLVLR